MAILTVGQNATGTLGYIDSVTVDAGASFARFESPTGTILAEFSGTRTFGPYSLQTYRVTAILGTISYTVNDDYPSGSIVPAIAIMGALGAIAGLRNPDGTTAAIAGGGGGGAWGAITGTLSAQTDLQAALNAKVTVNAAVSITGANTLTQAAHFNRHLSWTGASTAAQALSATASVGDFVELSNDGTATVTITGCTIAAGYELQALPGETFQAVYTNGAWVSLKLIPNYVSTVNSQSAAYTYVAADAGKTILHPAADTTARIFTMPANASAAFPIGTVIKVRNQNAAGALTLAITTDVQTLVGAAGSTGSRTLAAGGEALYQKETATTWSIRGSAELT